MPKDAKTSPLHEDAAPNRPLRPRLTLYEDTRVAELTDSLDELLARVTGDARFGPNAGPQDLIELAAIVRGALALISDVNLRAHGVLDAAVRHYRDIERRQLAAAALTFLGPDLRAIRGPATIARHACDVADALALELEARAAADAPEGRS